MKIFQLSSCLVLFFFILVQAGVEKTPHPELGIMQGLDTEVFHVGLNAVIWGYPMVKFKELMRGRTLPDALKKTGNPRSQVNQLRLMRHLRGPEFKQIATPNYNIFLQSLGVGNSFVTSGK